MIGLDCRQALVLESVKSEVFRLEYDELSRDSLTIDRVADARMRDDSALEETSNLSFAMI